jgi:hypothetical protein
VLGLFVAMSCIAAYTQAGRTPTYPKGMANGTINFEPECKSLVEQMFGNGHTFIPTQNDFVHIADTIRRCNKQAIAARTK